MRSLFLVLFLGVALAHLDISPDVVHKPRLVYRYEAQLVTGAPQGSKLWSGLHLSANLTLNFLEDETVVASMDDVSLQKMDKFLEERTPSFFMQADDTLLDGVEADVSDKMLTRLKQAFRFEWHDDGHVGVIWFPENEPVWSANIKRGIISLFEVNLDYTYSVEPVEDKGAFVHADMLPTYTVWEKSLFGFCRTTYTPVKPMHPKTSDEFYITKVRDYSSCVMKTPMAYVFNNVRPPTEDNSTDHWDMQAEVTYAIKNSRKNFQIQTAVGESKVLFVPWARQDGSIQTTINQTLYLIQAYPTIPRNIPKIMRPQKCSLSMVMPSNDVKDRKPYVLEMPHQAAPAVWTKPKLHQLLTYISNGTLLTPSKEVLIVTQTLVELMRQTDKEILRGILHDITSSADEDPLKSIKFNVFWNLLSTGATAGMADVLLRYCIDEAPMSRHKDCVSAISSIGLYSPPSENTILLLEEILNKSFKLKSDKKYAETMMVTALALGSVIGRGEDMVNDMIKRIKEFIEATDLVLKEDTSNGHLNHLIETRRNLVNGMQEIKNKHHAIAANFQQGIESKFLSESASDFYYILAFKAMRNAHVPFSIPVLKDKVTNSDLDPTLRIAAAQAFEKFNNQGDRHKREVIGILEQVMKDPEADVTIRIQAFRSLVNVHAPVRTLIRLAESIRYEKQRQLATYVWSVFHNIRNMTTFRPYLEASDKFQAAVAYIPPIMDQGYDDSTYRMTHMHLAKDASLLHELNIMRSPKYVVAGDLSSYMSLFGTTNKAFQVSWNSEGLVRVLKKMIGPDGFFTNKKSLFDLLHRSKRNTDVKDEIDKIFRKLNITIRTIPELKTFVDIQMMNSVIRSYDLTEILRELRSNCRDCQAKGTNLYQLPIDYKSSGLMGEFFMELPTEAGFPLSMQMGLAYSAKISGKAWATVSKDKKQIREQEQTVTTIQAGIDLRPHITSSLIGKMSVDGYLFQTGSVFHGTLEYKAPLNITAILKPEQNFTQVNFVPPVERKEPVLQLDLTPYVYSRAMPSLPGKEPRSVSDREDKVPLYITLQPVLAGHSAESHQVSWELNPNMLGYKVKLEGQYPWRPRTSAVAFPMLGKTHYSLYIQPGEQQPTYVTATLAVAQQICPKVVPTPFGERKDDTYLVPCNFTSHGSRDKPRDSQSQPIRQQTYWGIVATLKGCKENLAGRCDDTRSATLIGLVPAFGPEQSVDLKEFYNSSFHFKRSPLPGYDPKPWEMKLSTSAFFPHKTLTTKGLLSNDYQKAALEELFRLMKTQSQNAANKYFQQHVMTQAHKAALRRQPSWEPELMLDRIMPESIMEDEGRILMPILNSLTPISEQVLELKSEMKNAFKITARTDLIKEVTEQTLSVQSIVKQIFEMKQFQKPSPETEYVVLKLSQVVFDLREILYRASRLCPEDSDYFWGKMKDMDNRQKDIYFRSPRYILPVPFAERSNVPSVVQGLVLNLKMLANDQMDAIHMCWLTDVEKQVVDDLTNTTAKNVTLVNQYISSERFEKNETINQLLLQASVQHQILVEMLSTVRIQNGSSSQNVSNFHRYAIKVQTKQLTERAYVLRSQRKLDATCGQMLPLNSPKQLMLKLQKNDRKLAALQQAHIILPSLIYPWTSDLKNLDLGALNTMQEVLDECQQIRDALVLLHVPAHPCLTRMLVDTAILLQQKVDIFKRTLTAQPYEDELTMKYQALEDHVMSLQLSLDPVFDKYVNMKSTIVPAIVTPDEARQELASIERKQSKVEASLERFDGLADDLSPDVIRDIYEKANSKCQDLKERLQSVVSRVQKAMQNTDLDDAKSLKQELANLLGRQLGILRKLKDIVRDIADNLIEADMELIDRLREHVLDSLLPSDKSDSDESDSAEVMSVSDEGQKPQVCIDDFMNGARNMLKFAAHVEMTDSNPMCLQMSGLKSAPQLLWETAQYFAHTRDECVTRSVKETVAARDLLMKCSTEVKRSINSYYNVLINYDSGYEKLPKWIESLMRKMDEIYYCRTSVSPPNPFIADGSLQTVLEFSNAVDSVDMYYMSEKQTMETQSIPLSRHVQPWYPFQNIWSTKEYAMIGYTDARLPASCKVEYDNLRTFDSSVYHLGRFPYDKMMAKYSNVLSMDCSADKRYAIVLKPGDEKLYTVLIYAESHNVTIDFEGTFVVLVDRTAVRLWDGIPFTTTKLLEGQNVVDMEIISVDKTIIVTYPLVGLTVVMAEDNYIRVDVAYFYKGQVCGLCGNYNAETNSELLGPRMETYTAAIDFWNSYLMKTIW